ncbi:MAG: hypothetical protein WC456_00715 [Patescibacteria group bacterium]
MEQVIGIILLLSYISYILGKEGRFLSFSERLGKRLHSRRRISRHEYIEKVVAGANQKHWAEKRLAEDRERVKKNFLGR